MLHNPPCETWELHVERAYAGLKDGDDYDLIGFVEFLRDTYDEERLSADVAAGEGPFADWPHKWADIKKAKGAA